MESLLCKVGLEQETKVQSSPLKGVVDGTSRRYQEVGALDVKGASVVEDHLEEKVSERQGTYLNVVGEDSSCRSLPKVQVRGENRSEF